MTVGYTFTQTNNPPQLDDEIRASSLGSLFDGVITKGTSVTAYFTQSLTSDQQATLAGLVSGHRPVYTPQIVSNKIAAAKTFGMSLIDSIAVQNVLAGITQAGLTKPFVDYCANLAMYLMTGSLYAAVAEIDIMIADTSSAKTALAPFLNNTNLEANKNKIQAYLGIPLT